MRILTRYILGEILSLTLIGCALFTFILFMPTCFRTSLKWWCAAVPRWTDVARGFPLHAAQSLQVHHSHGGAGGLLLGLSRLAADSEIIAMRASGLGIGYFVRVASILAVARYAARRGQLALSGAARQPGHH